MIKRIVAVIVLTAAVLICRPGVCFADSSESAESALDEYSREVSSALDEAIDDDTRRQMRESGVSGSDLTGFGMNELISALLRQAGDSLRAPVVILARLTALLVMTAAARSLAPQSGLTSGFSLVSLLGCITIVYRTVYDSFAEVCGYLTGLNEFMAGYIPVYASVTAASGGIATGGGYYASALWVCEVIAFVADRVIMPFLSILLAVAFTAAINPDMRFSSAAESMKNAVRIILTGLMTAFSGLITIKSFAASAADNAAARAVRFGAASFIPIIGGSVSEAYSTVHAGLGIIRSGVGTLGAAVMIFMLIRPLVTLITIKLTLECARTIADISGLSEVSELLRSTSYAMSAAISTTLCFSMMFLISTAIMMPAAANIGQ